jgi:hypothetical protein
MSGLNNQFSAMKMDGPNLANLSSMAKPMKDKAPHIVDGGMPSSAPSFGGNGNMKFDDNDGLLEGFVLRKAEQRNNEGASTWRETTLKDMIHHPDELYRLIDKQQRERQRRNRDLSDLCDDLGPNQNRAVQDAVGARNRIERDPNYRWCLVYLHSKTRENPGGLFSRATVKTYAIEIILQRVHKAARSAKGGFKSSNDSFPGQFNPMNSMKSGNMTSPIGMGINMNSTKQGQMPQGQPMNFPQQKSGNFPGNLNVSNMGGLNTMKNMQQDGRSQMQNGASGTMNGGGPKIVPLNAPKFKDGNAGGPTLRSKSPLIVVAEDPPRKNRAMSNGQMNMNARTGGSDRRQSSGPSNDNHKRKGRGHHESSSETESDSEASYSDDSDRGYPSSYSSRPSKGYRTSKAYVKPHKSSGTRRQSANDVVYREHRRQSTTDHGYPVNPRIMNGGSSHQNGSGMRLPPHRSASISYGQQYDHRSAGHFGVPPTNNYPNSRAIMESYGYEDDAMLRMREDAMVHQAQARARARGQEY